ncbi:ROK family transcriptional regulator [Salipiger mangrovisoli]|uniref:ROK family transcriptional regulator n=1 Tax=Salipiger mangrovisoli TaxID=2865933 RepID=A0ABR9X4F9_9RHOB|nr:ROK family transcriptional regulator [Salipiger mangrovisoli]MBE9638343.1 ROK family transcriptional regulator [Salipiger mangrovisoli]
MALSGTNQGQARPHNRRTVLEAIRQHGPISRADIARRVGLTTQTVSTITSELLDHGFLSLRPGARKGRGFPAPCFEIAPEGAFAIGVSISPRGLEAGLMDLAGNLVSGRRVAASRLSAKQAFGAIRELVDDLASGHAEERILGVGISLPGPFGIEAMSFVGSTTMEGWSEADIREGLHDTLPYPTFVDGDMSAAAHGERLFGRGTEFRDFFYLYMGVGLGGAMIYNNQVMRGAHGNASEIGHIPIVLNGEPCSCGNRGCLERYFSLEAYDRRVPEIGEAAWLDEIRPIFCAAIVTIENMYEPETIVLGGQAPDGLLARLLALADDLPVSLGARSDRKVPRIVPSLAGSDAVIRGAASLAVNRVFAPGETPPDRSGRDAAPDLFSSRMERETR